MPRWWSSGGKSLDHRGTLGESRELGARCDVSDSAEPLSPLAALLTVTDGTLSGSGQKGQGPPAWISALSLP